VLLNILWLYRFQRENLSKHEVHKGHEGEKVYKSSPFPSFVFFVPFVVELFPANYGRAYFI